MFINVAMAEPWWVRFFGRIHWLLSRGLESGSTRRFLRGDRRINIYTNWMDEKQALELGQLVANYLVANCGCNPSSISGDLVDGTFMSRAFGPTNC